MTKFEREVAVALCDGWARYGDSALHNPVPVGFTLPMGRSRPYDPEDRWKAELVDSVLGKLGPHGRKGGRVYRLLVHVHRFGQPLDSFPLFYVAGGGFDDDRVREEFEANREQERGFNPLIASLGLATEDVVKATLVRLWERIFRAYGRAVRNGAAPDTLLRDAIKRANAAKKPAAPNTPKRDRAKDAVATTKTADV